MSGEDLPSTLEIDYTNHRGERRRRLVRPSEVAWMESPWHPGAHWILVAEDIEKGVGRHFLMANIHSMAEVET